MIDLLPEHSAQIEHRLRHLNWVAPGETLESFAPAGEGNMNRTLRVRVTGRTFVLKQSVPFVAKYPHIAAPADRIFVEEAFYRATAQTPALTASMARLLGFDRDNRLLCLEDLGAAADFTPIYRGNVSFAGQVAPLMSWLGALHSLVLDPERWPEFENREMRQLNHQHIFEIPLAAETALDLDTITPGLNRIRREMANDPALLAAVRRLGRIYLGLESPGSAAVLLHGDYYPGSWLRDQSSDGVNIIDPEFAFLGPGEFDLGVMFAHLTFAGIDRTGWAAAIENYHGRGKLSQTLVHQFAGVEVIRRLLGVAQLPLSAGLDTKQRWLASARDMVLRE